MNSDIFELKPIRAPWLDEPRLQRSIIRLQAITEGIDSDSAGISDDLLDQLRRKMKDGLRNGERFEQCTQVKRRSWLLLSLYLNDLNTEESRGWLPAFDNFVAASVLGTRPLTWKRHVRRLATQLYFTHFGVPRLPGLAWLARGLERSWSAAPPEGLDETTRVWASNSKLLFAIEGPERVAKSARSGVTVKELADSFHIHEGGLYRERLLEELILQRLRKTSLDACDNELSEMVLAEKDRPLSTGLPLGAEAVKILINRSQKERNSEVPKAWCDSLVTFACDPRSPSQQEQSRWWIWATQIEKDIAIRALSKITLEEFIKLLEESLQGSGAEHQFPARRDLLLRLFELGKVKEARLVVHVDLHRQMDASTRKLLMPSRVKGGPQHTSFICLRCAREVFLIEGTHSFALRGFIRESNFPVAGFWRNMPKLYRDSDFRVDERVCSIYQRHQGDWTWRFVQQLPFQGEWSGIA